MVHQHILDAVKSQKLKVYVVWTPVLYDDNREAARAALAMPAECVAQFWDEEKRVGLACGNVVTLPRGRKLAWDTYFVYDAEATWEDAPPAPADWMHQLANDDRLLDGEKLRAAVQKLLQLAI